MDLVLCHWHEISAVAERLETEILPRSSLVDTRSFHSYRVIVAVRSGCEVNQFSFSLKGSIKKCFSCHTSSSLRTAIYRILPNYIATYVPIATVMIANPCLYKDSIRDMQRIITSTSGQFTSRERDIIDAVKLKFSVINIVFYICWVPNLVNGILLWTLWFHLPATCVIVIWYIMVSPYMKMFVYCKMLFRLWWIHCKRSLTVWFIDDGAPDLKELFFRGGNWRTQFTWKI